MRVCVTGAAGFIGSWLCEALGAAGHEIVAIDNLVGGDINNLPAVRHFARLDCCELDNVQSFFEFEKPDIVYHAAAYPHEGLSVFSPYLIANNIIAGTMSVATAAINLGVKRFVNFSSMARYGNISPPFREHQECRPQDPYGIAKLATENMLFCLGKEHGMEVVNLVPHSVCGGRQRHYDAYRNVAAIFINRMLQGKQPIIYGDGEQIRCFSFIHDAMPSIIKAGFQEGLDGETINIGPDDEFVTVYDLARRIAKLLDFELKPIYMADRPCEVRVAYCSSDKARRLFGYTRLCTLDEGLAEMVAWFKKVGPREFDYHLPIQIPNGKRLPKAWKERLM